MRVCHTGGIAQAIEDGFLGRALLLGEVDEIELRGGDLGTSPSQKASNDPIGTPELSREPDAISRRDRSTAMLRSFASVSR